MFTAVIIGHHTVSPDGPCEDHFNYDPSDHRLLLWWGVRRMG